MKNPLDWTKAFMAENDVYTDYKETSGSSSPDYQLI
jgi:hypothetical protein